jgi:hypothetical protein
MNLSMVREYISLIDDSKGNPGHVMPCDIFRHLTASGMEQQKAAVTAGIISVLGGLATNPSFPFIAKAGGSQREAVQIPRNLDTSEVLKQGGKGLMAQALAIAEALIIPKVSQGLERRLPPPTTRGVKAPKDAQSRKLKRKKGIFQVFDMVLQNKSFLASMLGPLLKGVLKA